MQTGQPAVAQLLFVIAGLLAFVGVIALSKPTGGLARALGHVGGWRFLADTQFLGVSKRALSACGGWMNKFAAYWFSGSPRNQFSGGLFLVMVLAILPLAAALNFLRGGSPFLITVIIASWAGLALITVFAEAKIFRWLLSLIAVSVFLSLFIFVPGYTWVSFTHRLIGLSISQAALGSLLVLPLIYLACHSAAVGLAGIGGQRGGLLVTLTIYVAASIPVAFLLVIGAMFLGHLLVPDEPSILGWWNLMLGIGISAIAWALSFVILNIRPWLGLAAAILAGFGGGYLILLWMVAPGFPSATERAVAALHVLTGLSPDGSIVRLGPLFWYSHLPLVPAVLGLLALAGAVIAKLTASVYFGRVQVDDNDAATATGLALIVASLIVAALGYSLQFLA